MLAVHSISVVDYVQDEERKRESVGMGGGIDSALTRFYFQVGRRLEVARRNT